jgi:amino acid transporter
VTTPQLAAAFPAAPATTVVIVVALAIAAVCAVLAVRDKSTPPWVLAGVLLLELGLLVATVWAVIAWIGGNAPAEPVVFAFYLVAVLAIPPAMVWWGRGEPGRWGSGVVAAACLVLVVLVLRVTQVWTGAVPVT